MGLLWQFRPIFPSVAITILGGGYGFAQPAVDTYNPQTQQELRSGQIGNPITPSLMDMGVGVDQGNIGPFVTMSDRQFARNTVRGAAMEIQLGDLAVQKGNTPEVRELGQHLVDNYTRWSAGLGRAGARLGIELPSELPARDKTEIARIAALKGRDFDRAYLEQLVRLQNKALTITQYEAANGGVTGFRNWAGLMVPVLQDHLRQAKKNLAGGEAVSMR